jgi:hypothetical protein
MSFSASLVLYALIGVVVAAALFLATAGEPLPARAVRVAAAVAFWPLELPGLLAREPARGSAGTAAPGAAPRGADDEMAAAIARVEAELDVALAGLDGWAEDVLAREKPRIQELCHAWRAQAQRVRDIDALLATAGAGPLAADEATTGASEAARRQNLERLAQLRRQSHADLLGTLTWVRELVSMVHLVRFTGASSLRAGELVAQIAAAVEGLSQASALREEGVPTRRQDA